MRLSTEGVGVALVGLVWTGSRVAGWAFPGRWPAHQPRSLSTVEGGEIDA